MMFLAFLWLGIIIELRGLLFFVGLEIGNVNLLMNLKF